MIVICDKHILQRYVIAICGKHILKRYDTGMCHNVMLQMENKMREISTDEIIKKCERIL